MKGFPEGLLSTNRIIENDATWQSFTRYAVSIFSQGRTLRHNETRCVPALFPKPTNTSNASTSMPQLWLVMDLPRSNPVIQVEAWAVRRFLLHFEPSGMKEQSECPRGWERKSCKGRCLARALIDCTAMIDGIDTEKEISWRNSMNHETPGKECRKVLIMGLRQSLVPCNRWSEWAKHTILGRSVRRWVSCPQVRCCTKCHAWAHHSWVRNPCWENGKWRHDGWRLGHFEVRCVEN